MFGNVTTPEGSLVTGEYRDKSMTHTCSRHAAWDSGNFGACHGTSSTDLGVWV